MQKSQRSFLNKTKKLQIVNYEPDHSNITKLIFFPPSQSLLLHDPISDNIQNLWFNLILYNRGH